MAPANHIPAIGTFDKHCLRILAMSWEQRSLCTYRPPVLWPLTFGKLETRRIPGQRFFTFISLYCFLSVQYLNYISIFQLIALNIFYKQHIKTYVLSKTLKISPTCFGHLATILREIQYLYNNHRTRQDPTHTLQQACCCIYSLVTEVKTSIVSP